MKAVLVPHAPLGSSSEVAGHVLGALKGRTFRRIVVLGEHHEGSWRGIALPSERALATPLGVSLIDDDTIALLGAYPGFARLPMGLDDEPVIEAIMPFVQGLWPDTPIVPLLLAGATSEEHRQLARVLANVLDEGTLLIAAATFTHVDAVSHALFSLEGTNDEVEQRLWEHERPLVEAVLARSPARFEAALSEHAAQSCSYGALFVALLALGMEEPGVELARASSLQSAAQPAGARVVSYRGAVFPGRYPAVAALDHDDRLVLMQIAQASLAAAVSRRQPPLLGDLSPRLKQRGGAFVTVTKHGVLKGCMGRLGSDSVASAVAAAARMAAGDDRRFRPLRPEDLSQIEVEISVLGAFTLIDSPDDFELGRHGLLLTRGADRGLLLPQVATKYGMDRQSFLDALSEKAGLHADDWKGAKLERFGVDAFTTHGGVAAT